MTCSNPIVRVGLHLAVTLLLATIVCAAAAGQEPPAAEQPSPSSRAGATPTVVEAPSARGRVQCVVFTGVALRLIEGASVTIEGATSALTDRRGSAFLDAAPGNYDLRIAIPEARLSGKAAAGQGVVRVPNVKVMSGDLTRVLVTVTADGKLENADVLAPKPTPADQPEDPTAQTAVPAAPGQATGTVSGRVTSAGEGKPIAGAKLYVLGIAAEATSDADGRFTLDLPEGGYSLSIAHLEYTGQTLEGVVASAGAVNELAIALQPAPIEMEDFVVRGRRIRGSVASVMEDRRSATTVTDAIGVEDIRKSPDGTASAATRRVVGATVVGGQYLFVRGLGGRYSNVRLNDVPLPSTDPDVPGFQLDLFPASLLSSLTVVKTFTPDMPGDFAGGSMNIGTRDFPDRFDLSASLSLAADTRSLGAKVLTYEGGGHDFLGFDDGSRALPGEVPGTWLEKLDVPRAERKDRLIEISRAFPNRWQRDSAHGPPAVGLGFSIGNTALVRGHRAGYLLTFGYRYNVLRLQEKLTTTNRDADSGELSVRDQLHREIGSQEAQLGALGSLSYELATGHELRLVSLITQTGDDKTSYVTGVSNPENGPIQRTEYKFTERRLLFNQLLGNHDLSPVLIDWQLNMALAARDQPDARSVLFVPNAVGDFYYKDSGGSGEHAYADLGQVDFGGGANLAVPIDAATLKAGYLGRTSNRGFSARRFGSEFEGDSTAELVRPPEEIFTAENAGEVWLINEASAPTDGYEAKQLLNAGYGLAELPIADWLKLTGGARVEVFHQKLAVVAPAANLATGDLPSVDRTDTDVLPSGGAIFGLTDEMSLRIAYGGTVARPMLREISPAASQDFVRRRTIQGEPGLRRTYIHNFDVRWELFPSRTEVLAASVFYKRFLDPIETVVENEGGDLHFENTAGADAYGAELEGRITLGYLGDALDDLVAGANLALIRSEVELSDEQVSLATSQKRPLSGQSPFVVNLTLGYSPADTGLSLNVFYNVFGRRIQEVGILEKPDVYEEPFHSLDFTASYQLGEHWTLGATATNLLFQDTVVHEGKFEWSRIERGSTFGLRLGFAN